jgi:hypothetical protein
VLALYQISTLIHSDPHFGNIRHKDATSPDFDDA